MLLGYVEVNLGPLAHWRVALPPSQEMDHLLREAGPYTCHPGGSASNVLRAAARFGATTRLVGARGDDANGALYARSLQDAGICTDHLLVKVRDASGTKLSTAACCVISHNNERSMRTMFADTARLEISELRDDLFKSCKYLFVSSYACYFEGMLAKLADVGSMVGCRILLDLGSFEIVNAFSDQIDEIFGKVDICVCNEDEAAAFARLHAGVLEPDGTFDAAARWMLGHGVKVAVVVTLGERGCILYERAGDGDAFGKTLHPAVDPEGSVVDSTGAGYVFSSRPLSYVLSVSHYVGLAFSRSSHSPLATRSLVMRSVEDCCSHSRKAGNSTMPSGLRTWQAPRQSSPWVPTWMTTRWSGSAERLL